jgi:hypothetical protein
MHHTDIVGATRSGKTNFILSTLEGAFCFIDKHSDAARQIADSMECIYWRPADLSHCVAYNPLQAVPPDERWRVTADIVSVFSDIWNLAGDAEAALLPESICAYSSRQSQHDTDVDPCCIKRPCFQTWNEFNMKDARQQATEIGSLQNKVAALADALPLRLIVGQPTSTIDFKKILKRGTPLVIDLSDIGDEPAALLGALILNAFRQAADTARNKSPYRLVVDEMQNFGTHVLDTILAESGKRELWLTLAHQFVSQLGQRLWHSILANCPSSVSGWG